MADEAKREAAAWGRLQSAAPARQKYTHARRREQLRQKQLSFLRRVDRQPGGCWLWTGPVLKGPKGHLNPGFYHNRATSPDNATRSAFSWMMREWFPDIPLAAHAQTSVTCGNKLCINPLHRSRSTLQGINGAEVRLTPDQVREVYALRSEATATEIAARFHVHLSTVNRIWSGGRWRSVTGHTDPKAPPKMTANRAIAIYQYIGTGRTLQQVAEEFGVSRHTVRSIWLGDTWSQFTKAEKREPKYRQLSADAIDAILHRRGQQLGTEVAAEFGVSASTVTRIWSKAKLSAEQGT
jgi:DNA invertase Pin-like site-specific DNA recombinase